MNTRQNSLELSPETISTLPPGLRELGEALNHKLRTIAEIQEAQAGIRGTVELVTQTKKEPRGTTVPSLRMGGNRAASLGDPIDDQDIVTLGFLKKYVDCPRLADILDEDCPDFQDLLDDELDDPPAAASGTFTHFWGWRIHSGEGTTTMTAVANEVWVWRFYLPFDITISKVAFENTSALAGNASVGLYDIAGNLLCTSGALSVAATGVKTASFTPVALTQGDYYLAFTSSAAINYRAINLPGGYSYPNYMNKAATRAGKGSASAGGALNATLGTVTAFAFTPTNYLPPMCCFET